MAAYKKDVMMVTHNRLALTQRTVTALELETQDYRLIISDNGSTDGTIKWIRQRAWPRPTVFIRHAENVGKAAAMNDALSLSDAEYLAFIDNDVILPPEWLVEAKKILDGLPEIGVVSVAFRPGHPIQHVNSIQFRTREYGYISGAAMVFHRALHDRLGYCDEDFGLYGLFDSEWCFRVRLLGLKLAYIVPMGEHMDNGDTRGKRVARRLAFELWHDRTREYIAGTRPLYIGGREKPTAEVLA